MTADDSAWKRVRPLLDSQGPVSSCSLGPGESARRCIGRSTAGVWLLVEVPSFRAAPQLPGLGVDALARDLVEDWETVVTETPAAAARSACRRGAQSRWQGSTGCDCAPATGLVKLVTATCSPGCAVVPTVSGRRVWHRHASGSRKVSTEASSSISGLRAVLKGPPYGAFRCAWKASSSRYTSKIQ